MWDDGSFSSGSHIAVTLMMIYCEGNEASWYCSTLYIASPKQIKLFQSLVGLSKIVLNRYESVIEI